MPRSQKVGAVLRGIVAAEFIAPFSYNNLPDNLAKENRDATDRIRARITQRLKDIIAPGADLLKIKERLDHGQFKNWLDIEFGMSPRSAQKHMRATEWMSKKSELSSFMQPTTVYLLSAKSTPEAIQGQVIEAVKNGKSPAPTMVRHLIDQAKFEQREVDEKDRKKKKRANRKRNQVRGNRKHKKEEEERQRHIAAAEDTARMIASILVAKLTDEEVAKIYNAFNDWSTNIYHREAIAVVRSSSSEKVVKIRPKRSRWKARTFSAMAHDRKSQFDEEPERSAP